MTPNKQSPTKQEKTPPNSLKSKLKVFSGYALIILGILIIPIPILPGTILLMAGHQILKKNKNEN